MDAGVADTRWNTKWGLSGVQQGFDKIEVMLKHLFM